MAERSPIVMLTAPGRPTRRLRLRVWLAVAVGGLLAVLVTGFAVGWAVTGAPGVYGHEVQQ